MSHMTDPSPRPIDTRGILVIPESPDAVSTDELPGGMPVVIRIPEQLMNRAHDVGIAVQKGFIPDDLAEQYELQWSADGMAGVLAKKRSNRE